MVKTGSSYTLGRAGKLALWYTLNQMEKREIAYSLAIEEQDRGYLAYFPALPGCNTLGASYEEAVKNAREALTVYLESLEKLGRPLPKERTNEFISLGLTVRVPIIA